MRYESCIMSQQIDQFLDAQDIPGVIALGTTATDTIYEGAFGVTNVDTGNAITIDTPHAIMSMTKPVTSFAIMQLVEAGRIDLDAPATDYISRYQSMTVLDQVDLANKSYTTRPLDRDFSPDSVIPSAMKHCTAFARKLSKVISHWYTSQENAGPTVLPPGSWERL
jgi:hypothetical protein